jgi:hypothetical protein
MVGAYPLQGTKVNSRGKEMPHGTRLYSIAASRYGDKFDGKTTTLCVRRATYWDSEKVHIEQCVNVVIQHHGAFVCRASQMQVMT